MQEVRQDNNTQNGTPRKVCVKIWKIAPFGVSSAISRARSRKITRQSRSEECTTKGSSFPSREDTFSAPPIDPIKLVLLPLPGYTKFTSILVV